MAEADSNVSTNPYRKSLKVAVAAICNEVGYGEAEDIAIETLTEMLQSLLSELARTSRSYAELSGRTDVMVADCVMSMVDLGLNVESIKAYAKRPNATVLLPPSHTPASNTPRSLQVGSKKDHLSHIPDYLPPFPDTHTYIKTPSHMQPPNEYQVIREKAASQKRDVERALTRFIAKTGETHSLFKDDTSAFPLIACKPTPHPYLDALLPKDQELDHVDQTDAGQHKQPPGRRKRPVEDGQGNTQDSGYGTQDSGPSSQTSLDQSQSKEDAADNDAIDNPFLRPVKFPLKKGKYY
ncbi:transcription initiation factor TFIID subunit 8 [Lingula anatina]|uniref:Transcription initiation factor TFIID subunit 8 n=1 Tax=Lingula anatina TaxID=7574 RepID=A0A1S3I3Y2_LINAN|nr:transcription initiation factor TFIID subunit 8 [Lingula anatina]|eukprot:XP_013392943.1 transcription initiation factor TFIID subunit 8 [Lingula anatina]